MQLDLFGNPISPTSTSSPKEKKEIVFSNNQVTVKIKKPKEQPEVVELKPSIEKTKSLVYEKESKSEVTDNLVVGPANILSKKRGRKSYTETYANVDDIDLPIDTELKEKLYYSISEVSNWFKVTNSQIRFWENEFDILKPRKNRKGDRLFRVEDIQNLKVIYYLLRNRKFSIEGAKEYLKANKNKATTQLQLKDTLQRFRSFLLEIKINLEK